MRLKVCTLERKWGRDEIQFFFGSWVAVKEVHVAFASSMCGCCASCTCLRCTKHSTRGFYVATGLHVVCSALKPGSLEVVQ